MVCICCEGQLVVSPHGVHQSINPAHGTFCQVTPRCPVSPTIKPDTRIPKVLLKDAACGKGGLGMYHGFRRHWQRSTLLDCLFWDTEPDSTCFSTEQQGETAQWSPCSSSLINIAQQCERGSRLWGRGMLTQAFDIYEKRRKEEYTSRKSKTANNLTQFFPPGFVAPSWWCKYFFYLCLLVQIDLTMKQRDASQGKAGLLITIVHHPP